MTRPVANAFAATFQSLRQMVLADGALKTPEERKRTLRDITWESTTHWGGHLKGASSCLMGLFTDPIALQVIMLLLPAVGFTLTDMRNICLDGLRELSQRFAYTVNVLCDSDPSGNPMVHVSTALKQYISDAKFMAKWVVVKVISTLLDIPLDKELIPTCQGVVAPVQEIVDQVAAALPGLEKLFSVDDMLSDVIYGIADGQVDKATTSVDAVAVEVIGAAGADL